jgi:hypothetical protein
VVGSCGERFSSYLTALTRLRVVLGIPTSSHRPINLTSYPRESFRMSSHKFLPNTIEHSRQWMRWTILLIIQHLGRQI